MSVDMIIRNWFISLFCCLIYSHASVADALSLWRIDQDEATVFLLGSVHALKDDLYPLDQQIERAFKQSDKAVFEVDLELASSYEMSVLLQQEGTYASPQTIDTELTSKTRHLLFDYLNDNGLELVDFRRMRPWLLTLRIGMMELGNLGYKPELGIDLYYQRKARQLGKPILQMETYSQQILLLASDSPEIQDISLRSSLEELEHLPSMIDDLILAWQEGAADRMYELSTLPAERYPQLKDQMSRLLDKRNLRMAEKIRGYLKTDETYFVVVGALHMGGPQGLLALLRNHYKVIQLHQSGS